MRDLTYYLSLPWTIERREERDSEGVYPVLTVAELPGFLVAARTDDELDEMFWPALETFLKSYIEDGEEPPIPARARRDIRNAAADQPATARAAQPEQEVQTEWTAGDSAFFGRELVQA